MGKMREELVAEIGQTICGAAEHRPNPEDLFRCKGKGPGCIQASVGGGECIAYRQARAVVEMLPPLWRSSEDGSVEMVGP